MFGACSIDERIIVANGNVYTAALMEHNAHPDYKFELDDFTHEHEGVNPSCGDHMVLRLRLSEDGRTIEEAAFTGSGCAVSQASADIMTELITGEKVEEAQRLSGLFIRMIQGEELTEEVLEGPQSFVWDQADNRRHTQKAIMGLLMSDAEL